MVKAHLCAASLESFPYQPSFPVYFYHLIFPPNDIFSCTGRKSADLTKHKCSGKLRWLMSRVLYALCENRI